MSAGSGLFTKPTAYKPHIVKNRKDGLGGEVAKLRADLVTAFSPVAAIAVEEWDAPLAASSNAIVLAAATQTVAQVLKGTGLTGAVGGAKMIAPRRICVFQAQGAHYTTTPITVKGYDAQGLYITDTLTLLATGTVTTGDIVATTKFFSQVLEIDVPAQADAAGSLSFGFGLATGAGPGTDDATIGLSRPVKSRCTSVFALIKEIVDAGVVTTGTLVSSATDTPYGGYTPAAAPNGTHKYAIMYEYDATKG